MRYQSYSDILALCTCPKPGAAFLLPFLKVRAGTPDFSPDAMLPISFECCAEAVKFQLTLPALLV